MLCVVVGTAMKAILLFLPPNGEVISSGFSTTNGGKASFLSNLGKLGGVAMSIPVRKLDYNTNC